VAGTLSAISLIAHTTDTFTKGTKEAAQMWHITYGRSTGSSPGLCEAKRVHSNTSGHNEG